MNKAQYKIIAIESDQPIDVGVWTNRGCPYDKKDDLFLLAGDHLWMKREELVPIKLFVVELNESGSIWKDLSERALNDYFPIEEPCREIAFEKINFNERSLILHSGERVWIGEDAGDDVELDYVHAGCGGQVRSSYDGERHFEYCAKCDADADELEQEQIASI